MDIFLNDFLIRAIIAGGIVGLLSPILGIFLVVRRYSMLADTLAHASLPGVALSLFFNINPILSSALFSSGLALLIERVRRTRRVFSDALLAVFLSGSLALSLIIASVKRGFSADFYSYLFGSIATVSSSDVYLMLIFGLVLLFLVVCFFKEFFAISLDEDVARSAGLRVGFLNGILMVMTAVLISMSILTVGVLLIASLMIVPVLTAMQFGLSFKKTTILACIISCVSVFVGIFLSYFFDVSSSGIIVMVNILLFFGSLIRSDK
ncbi:MAG: metal ABC transporter permease [Candidatus Gracilibacteria bacterium]|jgi:zinc transport system permease protein|nr:metal ABC transporter permease [Candidatus Gracilibacteria bacterium]